jgi:thiamine biosynthesis protein ThiI
VIPVHVVPHGFVQKTFLDEIDEDHVHYNCLFSRRMMLRTAEALADEIDAGGLVTGESLAQVASQTLDNVIVTDDAVNIPVFRPLIGLNKEEIIGTAKKIATYAISTDGGIQCAANMEHPETHGTIAEMQEIEKQFDVAQMVHDGLEQAQN